MKQLLTQLICLLLLLAPTSVASAQGRPDLPGDVQSLLRLKWEHRRMITLSAQSTEPTTAPATRPEDERMSVPSIDYETETLDNGLRVVYAPMNNAPVVHVRVLYHVGSKDETPDRQGFAHMFEHMMFRGSAHVPSERHMELINSVGGNSNAFTGFDQTTYVNTVPSNALEMALWLEADRMSSFAVDAEKFATERNVVNEEYLQRVVAPPYGRLFTDFFALAYDQSHYRWTPIGDMDQLAEATPDELQEFFDTYYAPGNAVLTIAGDFKVEEAKQWIEDYFGWIPEGRDIDRRSPPEPEQTQTKRQVEYQANIPLPRITMGFKTTTYGHPDQEVLEVLANILGQGRSSRLYHALVAGGGGENPVANSASAGNQRLEGMGLFFVSVGVLPEVDPDIAEQRALDAIRKIAEAGVTADEVAKARTQLRLGLINQRQTADSVATVLAEAWAFGGDIELANKAIDRLNAITAEDVQRVAKQYLDEKRLSVLQYRPGEPPAAEAAASRPIYTAEAQVVVTGVSQSFDEHDLKSMEARIVAEPREAILSTQPSSPDFPDDYPTTAPIPQDVIDADFDMGQGFSVGPMKVVLIHDGRLPLVGMTLLLPGGGDGVPAEKQGLASLTADLLTRGAGGMSAVQWSEALESRGIHLNVGDGGDHTRISGAFPTARLEEAADFVEKLLREPSFDEGEFRNLKLRTLAGLQQALSNPASVAGRQMRHTLFGDTPSGRAADLATVSELTLDDVKTFYKAVYNPPAATLILAGDLNEQEARSFAETLVEELEPGKAAQTADYTLPQPTRQILVVDNAAGGQSAVRLGGRAFTIDNPDKYAASVATAILSGGIESRLNRSLRAEKGLTYGASGRFEPGRHDGSFQVSFNTKPASTGAAVQAAFEVLERMATEPVSDEELAEAKRRVTGSLVMSTQTVLQQAGLRASIEINDYLPDYYDRYAGNIAAVTKEDVERVMREFAGPGSLSIVVVGPAEAVVPQLEPFGEVQTVSMPLARPN